MRFISTRVHGMLDYLLGVILILVPLLTFEADGAATWVPVILGAGLILYSLFTDYELGMVKGINMPAHLWLDALSGLLLLLSPWLFGFADVIWLPHVILGLVEIGAALFTETVPSYEQAHVT